MALPPGLVDAIIKVESSGNPNAINQQTGATGLGQFMPATAASLGIDPTDPVQARAGIERYMEHLLQNSGGDLDKALAHYGGFVKKDPSEYIARVRAYMPNNPEPQQPTMDTGDQPQAAPSPTTKNFQFKDQQGRIHTVVGPADATPEQALAFLQQQVAQPQTPSAQDAGKEILEGTAALGTGTARGLASVSGTAGDVDQILQDLNAKAPGLPNWTPFPLNVLRAAPTTQQIRGFLNTATGGASEYKPPPEDQFQGILAAGGEGIPTWGKNPILGLASGMLGQFMANGGLLDNPDANRAIGNVLPQVAPIASKIAHAHSPTGIMELAKSVMNLFAHPLKAAANAAAPVLSAEQQYQSNQPIAPKTYGTTQSGQQVSFQ
jgi:hypothetical protein